MATKLQWKLAVNFLVVALGTIFLTGAIVNRALDVQFSTYLQRAEDERNVQVIYAVEDIFAETRNWNILGPRILPLIQSMNREIRIVDLNGNTLFDSGPQRRGMMMRRQAHIGEGTPYTTKSDFVVDEQVIGQIYVTSYIYPQGVFSREDVLFRATINSSVVRAGILAAIVALLLSFVLSSRVIKPIQRITEATRKFGKGDLAARVELTGSDEIASLGVSFNDMATSLEHLEKLRRQVTADISHELRTPLTTIKGYIEGLQDGIMPVTPQNFRYVTEEVDRLIRLVTDLQDLAKAEAPLFRKKEIDLRELLAEVAERTQPFFAAKHIDFKVEIADKPMIVLGDTASLQRAFYNILANAEKFTPESGCVTLNAQVRGSLGRVEITDSGIGINAEDLPLIFERFFRVDPSRTRKTGGTGIGLTIAQEVIQSHGGKIAVTSQLGNGTTFFIDLPVQS